jgi:hypothetical protein
MIEPAVQNLTLKRGITFATIKLYHKDKNGSAVPLGGYIPHAQVRRKAGSSTIILDLSPSVTDANGGEVTIPEISDEDTFNTPAGKYHWDYVLETPTGKRLGPYIIGAFTVENVVTQDQPQT